MVYYKSYSDLCRDIINNIYKINTNVDLIVGNPRSGMLPAVIIGLLMNKPVADIDSYLSGKIWGSGLRGK
ncbi:MAG TPA: phosphoribosyltransferase, partial [Spirochaetota bacterium]|nr:phosphoribosyltransferase [Spirochaetota bacterium]